MKSEVIMVLVIAFLWASFSGLLTFAFFEFAIDMFGSSEFIEDDLLRLVLYPVLVFLLVFLVYYQVNKPEEE